MSRKDEHHHHRHRRTDTSDQNTPEQCLVSLRNVARVKELQAPVMSSSGPPLKTFPSKQVSSKIAPPGIQNRSPKVLDRPSQIA